MSVPGIILTDCLIKDDDAASKNAQSHGSDVVTAMDYLNHSNRPLSNDQTEDRNLQVSCRSELEEWLRRMSRQDVMAIFNHDILLALNPLVRLISTMSSLYMCDIRLYLNRVANEQHDKPFPGNPDFCLYITRRLHKNIHQLQRSLDQNHQIILAKSTTPMDELTQDFVFLNQDIDSMLRRVEEDLQFLVSHISVQQAKLVNILTKVAILFVPITTVAAILSIPGEAERYWILGAITAPLVITLGVYLFFWDGGHSINAEVFKSKWSGTI